MWYYTNFRKLLMYVFSILFTVNFISTGLALYTISSDETSFNVSVRGELILQHTPEEPLLVIGIGTAEYIEHIGDFTINEVVQETLSFKAFDIQQTSDGHKITLWDASNNSETQISLVLNTPMIGNTIADVAFQTTAPLDGRYNRVWLRIKAEDDESVYGAGEQFSYFDLRGRTYPIWTREQGVGRNKGDDLTNIMDMIGDGGDYHTTYWPQPTFVSTRRYYFAATETTYSMLNFTNPEFHEVYIHNSTISGFFKFGSTLLNVAQSVSAIYGRQPQLPEWVYNGAILAVRGGTDRVMGILRAAQQQGVAVSALWVLDWSGTITTEFGNRGFWNWRWNSTWYPDLDVLIPQLKEEGVRVVAYVNPHLNYLGDIFQQAGELQYLIRDVNGSSLVQDFGDFYVGTIDVWNGDAWQWYKELIQTNMLDFGFSGWMADFGEYMRVDAVSAGSTYLDGTQLHNLLPLRWAQLSREAIEEAGRLNDTLTWMRSGYSGSSGAQTSAWAGDQTVDWRIHDGLPSTIPAALSLAMSGMGQTHFDIGGYTTYKEYNVTRTKELLLRSAEAAVFTPVMRTHEGNRPQENHQIYTDVETLQAFGRLTKIYVTLSNYTRTLVEENSVLGTPIQRPLVLHYDDIYSQTEQYQYLFGRDLLVAPVLLPEVDSWLAYLPPDKWVHLWDTENTVYEGPLYVSVSSPLGKPPVFYRNASSWTTLFQQIREM